MPTPARTATPVRADRIRKTNFCITVSFFIWGSLQSWLRDTGSHGYAQGPARIARGGLGRGRNGGQRGGPDVLLIAHGGLTQKAWHIEQQRHGTVAEDREAADAAYLVEDL